MGCGGSATRITTTPLAIIPNIDGNREASPIKNRDGNRGTSPNVNVIDTSPVPVKPAALDARQGSKERQGSKDRVLRSMTWSPQGSDDVTAWSKSESSEVKGFSHATLVSPRLPSMKKRASWLEESPEFKIPEQIQQLFDALDTDGTQSVTTTFLVELLNRNGLSKRDPRLRSLFVHMDRLGADYPMSIEEFNRAVVATFSLLSKCLTNSLCIPDFEQLKVIIEAAYETVEPNHGGANADYIPQLGKVDPEQFAISITSVDGQHFSIGDGDTQFCTQSCSKPISYLLALDKFGDKFVHRHVGTEPSGRPFNEMVLKDAPTPENPNRQIPHNPMINAGAIMTASMVRPDLGDNEMRLASVLDAWRTLSAAEEFDSDPIGYSEETYKSESSCANRNRCLGYMMLEKGAFPECFRRNENDQENLTDTLELYFQFCSVLSTNRAMSVMAATLANGGLNPWTDKVVCSSEHVRCVLPQMLSAGMYDYSGTWAYEVGVPAKSGVGGCVFMVVPNVCGISVWSPRLNKEGNSVRAVAVASELVKHIRFHGFEVLSGSSLLSKMDPRKVRDYDRDAQLNELLLAASLGEVYSLLKQRRCGADLFAGDYDGRTALHLAATEGKAQCVQFLVDCCDDLPADKKLELVNKKDRWQGTALDDAQQIGNQSCARILLAAFAKNCKNAAKLPPAATRKATPSEEGPELISAAARGDLDHLIKTNVRGADVSSDHHDYDLRTPLHLAASNGHISCVKYLVLQAEKKKRSAIIMRAIDRWGNTALDDACRESQQKCEEFLSGYVGLCSTPPMNFNS